MHIFHSQNIPKILLVHFVTHLRKLKLVFGQTVDGWTEDRQTENGGRKDRDVEVEIVIQITRKYPLCGYFLGVIN